MILQYSAFQNHFQGMDVRRLKIDLSKFRNKLFCIVCKPQIKIWKSSLKTSPIECVIPSILSKNCASLMLLQKFFRKLFAKRGWLIIFFLFCCFHYSFFDSNLFSHSNAQEILREGLVHYVTDQTCFSLWNSFSKGATLRFTQSPSIFPSFIKEVLFLLT